MAEQQRNFWEDQEIRALIGIWADDTIQRNLDGMVRNTLVFKDIAAKMAAAGFQRNADQCRRKIKKLKMDYKKVVDNNNRSGRGRSTCKYFEELSAILANRPEVQPRGIVEVGAGAAANNNNADADVAGEIGDVHSAEAEAETVAEAEPDGEATVAGDETLGLMDSDVDVYSSDEEESSGNGTATDRGNNNATAHRSAEKRPLPSTNKKGAKCNQASSSKQPPCDTRGDGKRHKKSKLEQSLGKLSQELKDSERRLAAENREQEERAREWEQQQIQLAMERDRELRLAAEERERKRDEEHFSRQMTLVQTVMKGLTNIAAQFNQQNNYPNSASTTQQESHGWIAPSPSYFNPNHSTYPSYTELLPPHDPEQ